MNNDLDPYAEAVKREIAATERSANNLTALAGDPRRAQRGSMADALLGFSRYLRVQALDLRGRLAAAWPLGPSEISIASDSCVGGPITSDAHLYPVSRLGQKGSEPRQGMT